jgi:hypothetical protein
MADMHINGIRLDPPLRREVHRHSWQWAQGGSDSSTCVEVVYPKESGGERMFLYGDGKDADFVLAITNHYIGAGWQLTHCDASSAVLVRDVNSPAISW